MAQSLNKNREPLSELNYVKKAENVINNLKKNKKGQLCLTTNKIRNLLTLINELYNKARFIKTDSIDSSMQGYIQYIKMRFVYEGGRDPNVKELIEKSNMLTYLDSIDNSKEKLLRVCHYMEALVAYHRYNTSD